MKKGIIKKELIGLTIEVIDSKNKSEKGLKGKIVDETKNTLKIGCGGVIKTLLKKNIMLRMDKKEVIEGKRLVKRPEERIK